MKIGVVGAGRIGGALARRFAASHEVFIGSRDSGRGSAFAAEIGGTGSGTYLEAAEYGDVVLFAVPWWVVEESLEAIGDVDGKILIDATNPYTDDTYTEKIEFIGTSAAEEIQKAKPKARVVKGWNTIHAQVVDSSPDFNGVPATVFLCGEDAQAKQVVAELAREIGYAPVDAGPLSSARFLEPMAGLKIRLSYDLEMGTEQTINLVER